jgi:hypothetical protein
MSTRRHPRILAAVLAVFLATLPLSSVAQTTGPTTQITWQDATGKVTGIKGNPITVTPRFAELLYFKTDSVGNLVGAKESMLVGWEISFKHTNLLGQEKPFSTFLPAKESEKIVQAMQASGVPEDKIKSTLQPIAAQESKTLLGQPVTTELDRALAELDEEPEAEGPEEPVVDVVLVRTPAKEEKPAGQKTAEEQRKALEAAFPGRKVELRDGVLYIDGQKATWDSATKTATFEDGSTLQQLMNGYRKIDKDDTVTLYDSAGLSLQSLKRSELEALGIPDESQVAVAAAANSLGVSLKDEDFLKAAGGPVRVPGLYKFGGITIQTRPDGSVSFQSTDVDTGIVRTTGNFDRQGRLEVLELKDDKGEKTVSKIGYSYDPNKPGEKDPSSATITLPDGSTLTTTKVDRGTIETSGAIVTERDSPRLWLSDKVFIDKYGVLHKVKEVKPDGTTVDDEILDITLPDAKDPTYAAELKELKEKTGLTEAQLKALADKKNKDALQRQAKERNKLTKEPEFGGFASVIAFLGNIIQAYNEYKGIAAFSSLFIDDEELAERRAEVNERFCKTVILGGTQCWASKVCESKIKAKPGDGTLVGREPVGPSGLTVPLPVAHVEAERSLPIEIPNAQGVIVPHWLYRWTYYLRNPMQDNLRYNIVFSGPGGQYSWWPSPQELASGASAGIAGSAAIPVMSNKDYRQICITLSPRVPGYDGKRVDEVCNTIVEYGGGATAPYPPPPNATTPGAPEGSTPGPGGGSGSCDDGQQNQGETGVDCGGPCTRCPGEGF